MKLRREGKYMIAKILEETPGSKIMVHVKWLGYAEVSIIEFSAVPKELQEAWDKRPHKDEGRYRHFDTKLYVCEPPPGLYGRVGERNFNILTKVNGNPRKCRVFMDLM